MRDLLEVSHSDSAKPEDSQSKIELEPAFIDSPSGEKDFLVPAVQSYRSEVSESLHKPLPAELTEAEFLARARFFENGQLTIAGCLLFQKCPIPRILPTARVQCFRYDGDNRKYHTKKRKIIEGTIPEQLSAAYQFVVSNIDSSESIVESGVKSAVLWSYSIIAIRELIANTLCHRDYRDQHRITQIEIFSDRIEILSPGKWCGQQRIEQEVPITDLVTSSIQPNSTLAGALAAMRMVEGAGTGLLKSIEDCAAIGAPPPTVKSSDGFVVVTLFPRRELNRKRMDFAGQDLRRSDFSGVDFTGSNFSRADLSGVDLSDSVLDDCDFRDAKLSLANLSRSSLRSAHLEGANLTGANLESTRFDNAYLGWTVFANMSLGSALGLENVKHVTGSPIGFETLLRGNIPEIFLYGCGVSGTMVAFLRSLSVEPFDFYSCFISYSSEDAAFARRLYDALQGRGIRCWLDEHQLLPGDDIHDEIARGIKLWDKVILCGSKSSLTSWWVDEELNKVFEKEHALMNLHGRKRLALIPLNLDGYMFRDWESNKKDEVLTRVAGNFEGWENDNAKFEEQFERLVKSLHADGRSKPPVPARRMLPLGNIDQVSEK